MKIKTHLSILIMTMLLSGCFRVSETLEKAEAEPDPAKAYEIVQHAYDNYCEESMLPCRFPPDDLREAVNEYFIKAAKSGNERILRRLYRVEAYLQLQVELMPSVLERAKNSENPDLLATAASIYGNSQLGVINTEQQVVYLKRAWEAGDRQSAALLAHIHVRAKDYENAYLWSLRCNLGCGRSPETKLDLLEKNLSWEQISKLQEAAVSKDYDS